MYRTETIEDQQKLMVPLNRDSELLYYNQRMIIDNKVLTEPRAWRITKVNRIASNGLVLLTLAQDKFDEHVDYIEFDNEGNVIGMWADYYSDPLITDDEKEKAYEIHAEISYTGIKPEIKVNGNYKTFTVRFYDKDNQEVDYIDGTWKFFIDDVEVDELINYSDDEVKENQVKIKFIGSQLYIGKVLKIVFATENEKISEFVEMDIAGL